MYDKGFQTPTAFARHLGLPRTETIFQIRRGNNGISLKFAEKITGVFPDVDEYWLLTGKRQKNRGIRIPLYLGDPVKRLRAGELPDNYILMPYESSRPLTMGAVNHEAEPIRGVLEHCVMLLEEVEREAMELGRPHLIETANRLILRFIDDDAKTGHYRLWSDNPARKGAQVIQASEIISVFALRYILNTY